MLFSGLFAIPFSEGLLFLYLILMKMKECCKTGNSPAPNNLNKYFKMVIYIVLIGIVVFAILKSI